MAAVLDCTTDHARMRDARIPDDGRAHRVPVADWMRVFAPEFLAEASVTWRADKPCLQADDVDCPEAREWDAHWERQQHGAFGRLCSAYRWLVRSRCVKRYIEKYFPTEGVFAECGCGSGETSQRLEGLSRSFSRGPQGSAPPTGPQRGRTYLAVDFCARALDRALIQPCYTAGVQSDIRALPFRDGSLDGLWNLGVLEHFETDDC